MLQSRIREALPHPDVVCPETVIGTFSCSCTSNINNFSFCFSFRLQHTNTVFDFGRVIPQTNFCLSHPKTVTPYLWTHAPGTPCKMSHFQVMWHIILFFCTWILIWDMLPSVPGTCAKRSLRITVSGQTSSGDVNDSRIHRCWRLLFSLWKRWPLRWREFYSGVSHAYAECFENLKCCNY
jgi:hypothetical protein